MLHLSVVSGSGFRAVLVIPKPSHNWVLHEVCPWCRRVVKWEANGPFDWKTSSTVPELFSADGRCPCHFISVPTLRSPLKWKTDFWPRHKVCQWSRNITELSITQALSRRKPYKPGQKQGVIGTIQTHGPWNTFQAHSTHSLWARNQTPCKTRIHLMTRAQTVLWSPVIFLPCAEQPCMNNAMGPYINTKPLQPYLQRKPLHSNSPQDLCCCKGFL